MLGEVQRRMADNVNRAAENFERYEAVTNLHVPAELYVQQVGAGQEHSSTAAALAPRRCGPV